MKTKTKFTIAWFLPRRPMWQGGNRWILQGFASLELADARIAEFEKNGIRWSWVMR